MPPLLSCRLSWYYCSLHAAGGDTWVAEDASAKLHRCFRRVAPWCSSGTPHKQRSSDADRTTSTLPPVGSVSTAHMPATLSHAAAAGAFSHRAPNGAWEAYSSEQAEEIARAMARTPDSGEVYLPLVPFVVKWGTAAVAASSQLAAATPSTMVQVNTRTGNMRAVRRDDMVQLTVRR